MSDIMELQGPAPDERRIQDYLAGRLDEVEAERFEERLLADEELAAEVQQALEIRAALADAASGRTAADRRVRRPALVSLAAAAGIAMIAIGVHWLEPPEPVFRTAEQGPGFEVEVLAGGGDIRARWAPVAGATGYEVSVLADDGRVLQRLEVDAASATLDLGAAERAARPAFLEVVALDDLGQVLRRSKRVAVSG
jgi:hypothetical protein